MNTLLLFFKGIIAFRLDFFLGILDYFSLNCVIIVLIIHVKESKSHNSFIIL